ncbi:stalk domain-containing protein [Paenibacillus sp.]|jgi:alpha-tubulin suppressor-like RCC1 family protein|uniref:stalk domain-containing protein n=1 Tax=Paenibacillus sp. TaxID=58172 RepID=UPI0028204DCB|nr:stalk domain-containing protein [Paenibacillus sp.]MDR0268132.1 hypothetical protein [Paenibacillus sp.]
MNKFLFPSAIGHRSAAVVIAAMAMFSGAPSLAAAGNMSDLYSTAASSPVGAPLSASGLAVSSGISTATSGTAFTQVAAGTYYSVGLRADGSVWTWGRTLWGELGLPDTSAVSSMVAPVRLSNLSDIVSITTSGSGYQLAVKKDGTVWEWGQCYDNMKKTQPPRQLAELTGVSQVSTQNIVNYALKTDGTVWAWSRNRETGVSGKPVQVQGLSKITSMNAAGDMVYTLDSAGSVWIFSSKLDGGKLSLSVPTRISGIPKLKQVSAYYANQMYGVDASGTAWKWSLDLASPILKLTGKPTKVYPTLKIKNIQAASDHAVLLTVEGDVWTFGKKPAGKDGKVKGLSGITSVSAGSLHSLVIDSKGQVWGWGANQWNEVGVMRNQIDGMVYAPVRIQNPITVTVNGQLLTSSFPAVMENNLISVPLKDVAKALGGQLTTTLSDGRYIHRLDYKQTSVTLDPRQPEVEINGQKIIWSSSGASGTTMVPASLLKQMGLSVNWDSKQSVLSINVQ